MKYFYSKSLKKKLKMGGSSSTPNFDALSSLSSNACPVIQGSGLSFTHVHSFDISKSFTQNLVISPRIAPRGQSSEEDQPGSYNCKFDGEFEGIQLQSLFSSNMALFSASIPYNDDFNFSIAVIPCPSFNLIMTGNCQTNVINASIECRNTNFDNIAAKESVVVQVSNNFIVGEQLVFDFSSNSFNYGLTASYQLGNFLFALTKDGSATCFGTKLYLNQVSSLGFMFAKSPEGYPNVFGFGYTLGMNDSLVEGSILSNLQISGKLTKQVSPNLGLSASLSYNILEKQTHLGFDIQLATGNSSA